MDTGRMQRRVVLIAGVVIVALVAALVAGELIARHTVKKCMAQQFETDLGTNVDIGLSGKPVLLQLIDKQVPYVSVDSDDSAFGPAKDMQVHAEVRDVVITDSADSAGSIGSSSAQVHWPVEGIQQTLAADPLLGMVTGVTADKTAGTLRFEVGSLAEMTVRPYVSGGRVVVDTLDARVLIIGLPKDLVDGVVKVIADSLQAYPIGMNAESLEVTDDGIDMTLAGGRFALPASMGDSSCGVLS